MDPSTTPAPDEALLDVVTEAALAHGEECLGLGRADAAVGVFGLAIVLARARADARAPARLSTALVARARAWEASGMMARALDDYLAVLTLAPEDPAALAGYKRLTAGSGRAGNDPRRRKPGRVPRLSTPPSTP